MTDQDVLVVMGAFVGGLLIGAFSLFAGAIWGMHGVAVAVGVSSGVSAAIAFLVLRSRGGGSW